MNHVREALYEQERRRVKDHNRRQDPTAVQWPDTGCGPSARANWRSNGDKQRGGDSQAIPHDRSSNSH
jgi:hypothetical protein